MWVDAQMDGYTVLGESVLTNGKDIHCPFIKYILQSSRKSRLKRRLFNRRLNQWVKLLQTSYCPPDTPMPAPLRATQSPPKD